MKQLRYTTRCACDLRLMKERGFDLDKIEQVIETLQRSEPLPRRHHLHRLKGKYKDHFECHIAPDWLLIWQEDEDTIYLIRTGAHAELF